MVERPPAADLAAFRASLGRCLESPDFLRDFYERFMASSEEIRARFAHTEFARQTRVLCDSLYVMANAAESRAEGIAWQELDKLAARHGRGDLDVPPRLYEAWLECLLLSARRHDAQFGDDTEHAWRRTLAPGLEHMRARY